MKQINYRFILGIMMVIIYLGMAALILFSDIFNIEQTFKIIIGLLFLIYGIFRAYRLYKSLS
ncbi:MAG: hypothetical protein LBE91_00280 [Tannerella sp.]|jgi:cytochrome c biogenesis protein CcdA|nr:hypothetical protein [Tannerella sp.]